MKKYLRSPKKYKHIVQYENKFLGREEIAIYGFDALLKEIEGNIRHEQWGRREYEISVSDAFDTNIDNYEKWDCYMQAKPNMVMITHEVLRQYKEQLKKEVNK